MVLNVPHQLMQSIRQSDPAKPYDICLNCEFLQTSCDGPNILAMDYPRWVEWANTRAKQLHLTRAQIAEQANLPKSTLDTILSGRTQDIRASTMRAITKVLVGGCWGQYPCHLAALLMESEELRVDEQIAALQRQLKDEQDKTAALTAQIETVRQDGQKKTDWLKERCKVMDKYIDDQTELVSTLEKSVARKERTIAKLCVIIALMAALVIGGLIYDKLHPDRGWIQAAETGYYIPTEATHGGLYPENQKI